MSYSLSSRFARPFASAGYLRSFVELVLELFLVRLFLLVYNAIRNTFGSVSCSPQLAWEHAAQLIKMEKFLGIYHEEYVQQLALPYKHWISFWNCFYFYFMFPIAFGVIAYVFIWHPKNYQQQRNTFLVMNCLALLVYAVWPLMPPRLLSACDNPYGLCMKEHKFVDTMRSFPLPGKELSLKVSTVANHYAAMPSMHVGYAMWTAQAIQHCTSKGIWRFAGYIYPLCMTYCTIVTGNHYILDCFYGALAAFVALKLQHPLPQIGRGSYSNLSQASDLPYTMV